MSLSYSNLPVYVGGANSSSILEQPHYISAIDANVSFSASAAAKRNLGQTVYSTDQFKFQGPRTTNISFKFILDTSVGVGSNFLVMRINLPSFLFKLALIFIKIVI